MADDTAEPKSKLRTVIVFAMLFAILGAVVVFAYYTTFRRPVMTVILIRHAEKIIDPNNPDVDLSPAGQVRAQELTRVFGDAGINAIYATQYKRTQQTVKPLADKLGLPVNIVDSKKPTACWRRFALIIPDRLFSSPVTIVRCRRSSRRSVGRSTRLFPRVNTTIFL